MLNEYTRVRQIATILATRDRLLTAKEMAFNDYMAARASLTQTVPSQISLRSQVVKPFYLVTNGLGTLTSTMSNFFEPRLSAAGAALNDSKGIRWCN